MNFFKTLFSGPINKEDSTTQSTNDHCQFKIYFSTTEKISMGINLKPETTCEDILNEYNGQIHGYVPNCTHNNDDYEFVIFTSNKLTCIALSNRAKAYTHLLKPGYSLYYLAKNKRNPKLKEGIIDTKNQKTTKPTKVVEVIKTGDIMIYKPKKKCFRWKKAKLTSDDFSFLKTKKTFQLSVNSIAGIYRGLTVSSDETKKLIKEDNIIELQLTNQQIFILRLKKINDYLQWANCFENVLSKKFEEQLDQNLTNLMFHYCCRIGESANLEIEHWDNLHSFIRIETVRKMFFSLFKNKQYSDIFETILNYKESISSFNYFISWGYFRQCMAQLSIETFDQENEDNQKKILGLVSLSKINQLKDIKEQIKSFMEKATSAITDVEFGAFLKEDLFDEIYDTMINNYLIPFYENPQIKEDFNKRITSIIAIQFRKLNNFNHNKLFFFCPDSIEEQEQQNKTTYNAASNILHTSSLNVIPSLGSPPSSNSLTKSVSMTTQSTSSLSPTKNHR